MKFDEIASNPGLSTTQSRDDRLFATFVDDFDDPDNRDDFVFPQYHSPCTITIHVHAVNDLKNGEVARYGDVEILNFEVSGADDNCFPLIDEGVGLDYFITEMIGPWKMSGDECVVVIEGVTGHYIKGDWGFTDDDEEWYVKNIRMATSEERKHFISFPRSTTLWLTSVWNWMRTTLNG